jgi:hypothetical protein
MGDAEQRECWPEWRRWELGRRDLQISRGMSVVGAPVSRMEYLARPCHVGFTGLVSSESYLTRICPRYMPCSFVVCLFVSDSARATKIAPTVGRAWPFPALRAGRQQPALSRSILSLRCS